MVEQQKVFSTALWGFEKKAVLDYIYEQDMLFKKKEADWEQRLAEYETKLGLLEQEAPVAEQYQEQLDALTVSYNEEKETAASLQTRYDKLSTEVEQLVQVAKNKERELQLQLELNNQLRGKCETLEEKLKVLAEHVIAERELTASLTDPSVIPKVEPVAARSPVFVAEVVEAAPPVEVLAEPTPECTDTTEPAAYVDLKTELTEFRQAVSKTLLNFEAALARLESDKIEPADTGENTVFFR